MILHLQPQQYQQSKMENTIMSYKDLYRTMIPCKQKRLPNKLWIITKWLTILQLLLVTSATKHIPVTENTDNIREQITNTVSYQLPFTANYILTIFTSEPVSKYPLSVVLKTNWPYVFNMNKLQHSLHGNGRKAYNIITWNCRKGLIQESDEDTPTFVDVKSLIQDRKPHILGIIEADIHGHNSTNPHRRTRFSTAELKNKLQIDGYKFRTAGRSMV